MIVVFQKSFDKQHKRLRQNERQRVKERLALFVQDEFHPLLSNHPLRGQYHGYRSINIGGDLRAIFRIEGDRRLFISIDIHDHLYK